MKPYLYVNRKLTEISLLARVRNYFSAIELRIFGSPRAGRKPKSAMLLFFLNNITLTNIGQKDYTRCRCMTLLIKENCYDLRRGVCCTDRRIQESERF